MTWIVSRGGCGGAIDRLGGEVERDAEDVGVLDVEQAVLVQVVGLAAERAADDLLAEELRAEGADAEDVGDGVGVPALGEHRDRDDAADRLAELAVLADGVHHLAQQVLVGDARRPAWRSPVRSTISRRKRSISSAAIVAEVVVERLAGFELLAVDQQRVAAAASGLPCSSKLRKSGEAAVLQRGRCRPRSRGGSRRCSRRPASRSTVLLQTTMKQGGTRMPASLPELERLLVVAVERLERGLQLGRAARAGRASPALPRPFLGMSLRMCSQRLRNIGISPPGMLSATGTRGSLTMPHSIASISEKSLIVQGNSVPSA